jgi:hypothetical protein
LGSPHFVFIKALNDARGTCHPSFFRVSFYIICAFTYFVHTGKCISSFLKAESRGLNVSDLSAVAGSKSAPECDVSLFLDQEEAALSAGDADQLSEGPRGFTASFAESAARTFEDCVFESRKICLRQIMKCICSAQIAKDPKQSLENIHAEHGNYVLQIVQVVTDDFLTKIWVSNSQRFALDYHSSF